MKSLKKYTIGLIVSMAMLGGCANDESQFASHGMLQITAEFDQQSRALDMRTQFDDNDQIGIYLSSDNVCIDQISATYNSGKWTLSKEIDLTAYPSGVDVMAYYPFDATVNEFDAENKLIKYLDLDVNNFQTDILTSNCAMATAIDNTVNLKFVHTLSCIRLQIVAGSDLNSDGHLNSIVFDNLVTDVSDGYVLASDGSKSFLQGYGPAGIFKYECNGVSIKKEQTFDLLMLPQTFNGNLNTTLYVDDKAYHFYLPATDIEAGEIYTFAITVDDALGSIEDEIYFGDYKGVYLGINYQGSPIYWADRNLGADTPEASGDYFAWGAKTPGKDFTEENFLGSSSTGDIGGTNADAARRLMGYGWRLPSQNEINQLINLKKERVVIDDVTGWTFTADNGNQIFLPNAGCYFGNECFAYGESGYYWTANGNTATTAYALNLSWLSAFLQPDWNKAQGCSIRAVISLN